MSIIRIGSNDKYANGWDIAFGGKKSKGASAASTATKKKASPKKAGPKGKGKKGKK